MAGVKGMRRRKGLDIEKAVTGDEGSVKITPIAKLRLNEIKGMLLMKGFELSRAYIAEHIIRACDRDKIVDEISQKAKLAINQVASPADRAPVGTPDPTR